MKRAEPTRAYTAAEIRIEFGVGVSTLNRHVKEGHITPVYAPLSTTRRYRGVDLNQYLHKRFLL